MRGTLRIAEGPLGIGNCFGTKAMTAPRTITFAGKEYAVGRRDCPSCPYVLLGPRGGAIELRRNSRTGLLTPLYVGRGKVPARCLKAAFADDGPAGLREVEL